MRFLLAVLLFGLFSLPATAQNFQFELSEQALNKLVGDLGNPGAGGVYLPTSALDALGYSGCTPAGTFACTSGSAITFGPSASTLTTNKVIAVSQCRGPDGQTVFMPSPDPIPWQWWITDAHFTVVSQQLNFSANVHYRIGSTWFKVGQTVPATLAFDFATQRLRMQVSNFKVPIRHSESGSVKELAEVDVSRHMSFSIPTSKQKISVPDLSGANRTVTSRVDSAEVQYLPGKVQVKVDAGFN